MLAKTVQESKWLTIELCHTVIKNVLKELLLLLLNGINRIKYDLYQFIDL